MPFGLLVFVLLKIHSKHTSSHCVSSDQAANAHLPAALLSIARRKCDVCMANRSCYERAANIFLKTGLKKKCRTLENEAIEQRRSATLQAFDAVALLLLSLQFQYAVHSQADSQLYVGSFNRPDQ